MRHSASLPRRATSVVLITALLALVALVNAAPAAAGTQVQSVTVPPTETNYSVVVDIPQFDQTNGALRSVDIQLTAGAEGLMQVENLSDSSASTGTVTLGASVQAVVRRSTVGRRRRGATVRRRAVQLGDIRRGDRFRRAIGYVVP